MQSVVAKLQASGIRSSYEHPGYIHVPTTSDTYWAFGDSNPQWGGNLGTIQGESIGAAEFRNVPSSCEDPNLIASCIMGVVHQRKSSEDLTVIRRQLMSVGFQNKFIKQDNRGSEYGHWEIILKDSDNIELVRHNPHPDKNRDFKATFKTVRDIVNWAKDFS